MWERAIEEIPLSLSQLTETGFKTSIASPSLHQMIDVYRCIVREGISHISRVFGRWCENHGFSFHPDHPMLPGSYGRLELGDLVGAEASSNLCSNASNRFSIALNSRIVFSDSSTF